MSLKSILEHHKGKVRLAFLHLPLTYHVQSRPAALSAWAASQQGRFFEYAERLFALDSDIQPDVFRKIAGDLKLDQTRFEQDRGSSEANAAIDYDIQQAQRAGVLGTPSFLVNGVLVRGAIHLSDFNELVKILQSKTDSVAQKSVR